MNICCFCWWDSHRKEPASSGRCDSALSIVCWPTPWVLDGFKRGERGSGVSMVNSWNRQFTPTFDKSPKGVPTWWELTYPLPVHFWGGGWVAMVIFAFFNGVFELIKRTPKKSSYFRFNNLILYFVRETNWLCCDKKTKPTGVYPTR